MTSTGPRQVFSGLVALLLLVSSAGLQAADNPNPARSWDNLKQLSPGDQIRIVLNDAKTYNGQFQVVSDDGIVVRLPAGEQAFSRDDVLRVSAKGPSHRGRNALIGMAIGGGAGAVTGAAASRDSEVIPSGGVGAAVLGFWFGAMGAGVGALVPTGGWYDVYRAR